MFKLEQTHFVPEMPFATTIQILSQNSYYLVQLLKAHFAIILNCKFRQRSDRQRINLKKESFDQVTYPRRFENSSLINERMKT